MRRLFIPFVMLAVALTLFASCKKVEGTGGESTIRGTIMTKVYDNDYKYLQKIVPAEKEDVFIVYGNDASYGDKISTSYNGTYMFEYLRPGNYTIFFYSDTSGVAGKVAVVQNVHISTVGKTITVDTLYKVKIVKVDDGKASISGTIMLINWKNNFTEIKDTSYAQEYDVYVKYGNHEYYDLHTKTDFKGLYSFPNLIKGDYTIYVFSDDRSGATQKVPVIRHVEITDETQSLSIEKIIVDKS